MGFLRKFCHLSSSLCLLKMTSQKNEKSTVELILSVFQIAIGFTNLFSKSQKLSFWEKIFFFAPWHDGIKRATIFIANAVECYLGTMQEHQDLISSGYYRRLMLRTHPWPYYFHFYIQCFSNTFLNFCIIFCIFDWYIKSWPPAGTSNKRCCAYIHEPVIFWFFGISGCFFMYMMTSLVGT